VQLSASGAAATASGSLPANRAVLTPPWNRPIAGLNESNGARTGTLPNKFGAQAFVHGPQTHRKSARYLSRRGPAALPQPQRCAKRLNCRFLALLCRETSSRSASLRSQGSRVSLANCTESSGSTIAIFVAHIRRPTGRRARRGLTDMGRGNRSGEAVQSLMRRDRRVVPHRQAVMRSLLR